MINILSTGCSLAFAPYLLESAAEFLTTSRVDPRVVRQGGSGLIIRSDGALALRHQARECLLDIEDVRHYAATLELRADAYEIRRMTDEVVMSTFRNYVLLSHPQSELWLEPEVAATLIQVAKQKDYDLTQLPEWLSASYAAGGLLLSDQRSGRWVLLGSDHIAELERRLVVGNATHLTALRKPPTIDLKGLTVHLQSAVHLARTLEDFASTGSLTEFQDLTPSYTLTVSRSSEGIQLQDSINRVALSKREAHKWAGLITAELNRLAVVQQERGRIRTVFADADDGRWILQWGDELLHPDDATGKTGPLVRRIGEFTTLLDVRTSHCVALTDSEATLLRN